MAQRIRGITPVRPGAPPKYPWDEWADGSAWRIVQGEDYAITSRSMASSIRSHAASIGKTASAFVVDGGKAVEFRITDRARQEAAA